MLSATVPDVPFEYTLYRLQMVRAPGGMTVTGVVGMVKPRMVDGMYRHDLQAGSAEHCWQHSARVLMGAVAGLSEARMNVVAYGARVHVWAAPAGEDTRVALQLRTPLETTGSVTGGPPVPGLGLGPNCVVVTTPGATLPSARKTFVLIVLSKTDGLSGLVGSGLVGPGQLITGGDQYW